MAWSPASADDLHIFKHIHTDVPIYSNMCKYLHVRATICTNVYKHVYIFTAVCKYVQTCTNTFT